MTGHRSRLGAALPAFVVVAMLALPLGSSAARSNAPERGRYWTFDVRPLVVKSFSATPAKPRAGWPFTLRMSAIRTATGTLARGKVGFSFTAGGRSLRPRKRAYVRGQAICVFAIPQAAKGKQYRTSISIGVGRDQVARSLQGTIG